MNKITLIFFTIITLPAAIFSADTTQPLKGTSSAAKESADFYNSITQTIAKKNIEMVIESGASSSNQTAYHFNMGIQAALDGIGIIVLTKDFDDSFFNLDTDAVGKYTPMLTKLYQFLLENGFLVEIGSLYPHKILKSSSPIKTVRQFHEKLRPFYTQVFEHLEEGTRTTVLLLNNKNYLFHKTEKGIFFRNKLFSSAITPPTHVEELFTEKDDLVLLLEKMHEINRTIVGKVVTLSDVFNSYFSAQKASMDDARTAFSALIEHEDTPPILKKRLTRSLVRDNIKDLAEALKVHLKNAKEVAESRRDSLQNISPAPIDIFLLYSMYLFEESKTDLFGPKSFPVLESFTDIDDLSISQLLAAPAHQVMEQLGINLEDDVEPTHNNNKKSTPVHKKKTKASKPKKGQKKAKKPVAKIVHKVERDDESEESEEKAHEIPSSTASFFSPENLSTSSLKKTKPIIYSLSDTSNSLSIPLEIGKGHRMLDRIARLLAAELALDIEHSAGSLSLALLPAESGDKIVISAKANRANQYLIENLLSVIKQAQTMAKDAHLDDIPQLKEQFTTTWQGLSEDTAMAKARPLLNQVHALRKTIDLKKLALLFYNHAPHDPILLSLYKLLPNLKAESVIILDNPFNWHSEMVMAQYLRRAKKKLGTITTDLGTLPYQYIAGSLLNCAQCNAILRGGQNIVGLNRAPKVEMALFSRGAYNALYPGYVIPLYPCHLNHVNRSELSERLGKIEGEKIEVMSRISRIKMQYSALSDSDHDSDSE